MTTLPQDPAILTVELEQLSESIHSTQVTSGKMAVLPLIKLSLFPALLYYCLFLKNSQILKITWSLKQPPVTKLIEMRLHILESRVTDRATAKPRQRRPAHSCSNQIANVKEEGHVWFVQCLLGQSPSSRNEVVSCPLHRTDVFICSPARKAWGCPGVAQ